MVEERMSRWPSLVATAALLAACGSFDGTLPGDPAREVFGISTPQRGAEGNTTVTPEATNALDWKVRQICSTPSAIQREDVEAAEPPRQLVDRQLRCSAYRLSILGVDLSGLSPF